MGYNNETIDKLRKFRKNMGSDLYREDAKKIFRSNISYLQNKKENPEVIRKIAYTKQNIKNLLVFNFVKFVSITGSTSAGIAKENDDIDIMVVVKNGTSWIYRALLFFKNSKEKKIRRQSSKILKDLFCVNMIVEERALEFDDDLFNLHELYYMIPIFNEKYLDIIFSKNEWVRNWGGVINNVYAYKERHNYFFYGINSFFFISQLLFMIIKKHKPNIKRVIKNFLEGKIEFFPERFKYDKLKCI